MFDFVDIESFSNQNSMCGRVQRLHFNMSDALIYNQYVIINIIVVLGIINDRHNHKMLPITPLINPILIVGKFPLAWTISSSSNLWVNRKRVSIIDKSIYWINIINNLEIVQPLENGNQMLDLWLDAVPLFKHCNQMSLSNIQKFYKIKL